MAYRRLALGTVVVVIFLVGLSAGLTLEGDTVDDRQLREVAGDVGIEYRASEDAAFGNGRAGVYVADVDDDGHEDVLAIGGDRPALFRNIGGAFERTDAIPPLDITVKGALFFDHDNDGQEDLLLLPLDGRPVFLENRDGTFRETDVGLDTEMRVAMGASAADYTDNGCPDLFVVQSGDWRTDIPARAKESVDAADDVLSDNGNPNLLFAGDCSSFERVEDAGVEGTRWSLATTFADITNDGRPDVHVANDFNHDVVYLNHGNGTFDRVEPPETDRHGMSSAVADVTGNGYLDVFVTNIHFQERIWTQKRVSNVDNRGNNLLVNHGDGTFSSREREYGVRDGGWGWAAVFVDLDNDGTQDLVHTTRHYLADRGTDGPAPVPTRPRIWRGTAAGFERLNATAAGFETSNGRGVATLDYDRDGRRDIVLADHHGNVKLYENRNEAGNWLQVALDGDGSRTILGTEVYVTTDAGTQFRYLNAGADFLSQDSRLVHVGLGQDDTVDVRVVWPDGTVHRHGNVAANSRIVVSTDGTVESASE